MAISYKKFFTVLAALTFASFVMLSVIANFVLLTERLDDDTTESTVSKYVIDPKKDKQAYPNEGNNAQTN